MTSSYRHIFSLFQHDMTQKKSCTSTRRVSGKKKIKLIFWWKSKQSYWKSLFFWHPKKILIFISLLQRNWAKFNMIFKISIIIKLLYIVESYFSGIYEEKRVQKFFYNSANSIWECIGMQTCKQWQQFTQVSCISCNTHILIYLQPRRFNLNPVLNPSGLESEFFSV